MRATKGLKYENRMLFRRMLARVDFEADKDSDKNYR